MAVKTNNAYGKITISDATIEKFVAKIAVDCYGIVEYVPNNFWEHLKSFFNSRYNSVVVHSFGDRIFIDLSLTVKYGVSIKAVVESLKESVRYKVERFTGMIVDTINVYVKGIQK